MLLRMRLQGNHERSKRNKSQEPSQHFSRVPLSSIMDNASNESEYVCPLCMEEMDVTDRHFQPCPCGYQICLWCWHQIMEMANKDEGRCPACRTPYDKEKVISRPDPEELTEIAIDKKSKLQKQKTRASENRKHLSNVRVIQRNLVYVVGLPLGMADEELLEKKDYFGQYGKVTKIAVARSSTYTHAASPTAGVYVTYTREEDALKCIQTLDGCLLEGKPMRACFGTTKYCNSWIKSVPCTNPDCLYLHDIGTQEDSFTKEEMLARYGSNKAYGFQDTSHIVKRAATVNGFPPPLPDSTPMAIPSTTNAPSAQPVGGLSKSPVLKGTGLPPAASWASRTTAKDPKPAAPRSQTVNATSMLHGQNSPYKSNSLSVLNNKQLPSRTSLGSVSSRVGSQESTPVASPQDITAPNMGSSSLHQNNGKQNEKSVSEANSSAISSTWSGLPPVSSRSSNNATPSQIVTGFSVESRVEANGSGNTHAVMEEDIAADISGALSPEVQEAEVADLANERPFSDIKQLDPVPEEEEVEETVVGVPNEDEMRGENDGEAKEEAREQAEYVSLPAAGAETNETVIRGEDARESDEDVELVEEVVFQRIADLDAGRPHPFFVNLLLGRFQEPIAANIFVQLPLKPSRLLFRKEEHRLPQTKFSNWSGMEASSQSLLSSTPALPPGLESPYNHHANSLSGASGAIEAGRHESMMKPATGVGGPTAPPGFSAPSVSSSTVAKMAPPVAGLMAPPGFALPGQALTKEKTGLPVGLHQKLNAAFDDTFVDPAIMAMGSVQTAALENMESAAEGKVPSALFDLATFMKQGEAARQGREAESHVEIKGLTAAGLGTVEGRNHQIATHLLDDRSRLQAQAQLSGMAAGEMRSGQFLGGLPENGTHPFFGILSESNVQPDVRSQQFAGVFAEARNQTTLQERLSLQMFGGQKPQTTSAMAAANTGFSSNLWMQGEHSSSAVSGMNGRSSFVAAALGMQGYRQEEHARKMWQESAAGSNAALFTEAAQQASHSAGQITDNRRGVYQNNASSMASFPSGGQPGFGEWVKNTSISTPASQNSMVSGHSTAMASIQNTNAAEHHQASQESMSKTGGMDSRDSSTPAWPPHQPPPLHREPYPAAAAAAAAVAPTVQAAAAAGSDGLPAGSSRDDGPESSEVTGTAEGETPLSGSREDGAEAGRLLGQQRKQEEVIPPEVLQTIMSFQAGVLSAMADSKGETWLGVTEAVEESTAEARKGADAGESGSRQQQAVESARKSAAEVLQAKKKAVASQSQRAVQEEAREEEGKAPVVQPAGKGKKKDGKMSSSSVSQMRRGSSSTSIVSRATFEAWGEEQEDSEVNLNKDNRFSMLLSTEPSPKQDSEQGKQQGPVQKEGLSAADRKRLSFTDKKGEAKAAEEQKKESQKQSSHTDVRRVLQEYLDEALRPGRTAKAPLPGGTRGLAVSKVFQVASDLALNPTSALLNDSEARKSFSDAVLESMRTEAPELLAPLHSGELVSQALAEWIHCQIPSIAAAAASAGERRREAGEGEHKQRGAGKVKEGGRKGGRKAASIASAKEGTAEVAATADSGQAAEGRGRTEKGLSEAELSALVGKVKNEAQKIRELQEASSVVEKLEKELTKARLIEKQMTDKHEHAVSLAKENQRLLDELAARPPMLSDNEFLFQFKKQWSSFLESNTV